MIGLVWRAALSHQNQQFSRGRIHEGLDLIGGQVVFVCTNVRVCVCACLRPWEGWLCKPELARANATKPVRNERWWQHGGREAEEDTRRFIFFMRTNTHLTGEKQKAAIYNTAALISTFFCYRIWALNRSTEQSESERERKQRARGLSRGRVSSNCYWRRWPAVNRLFGVLEIKPVRVVYAECVCSLSTSHKQ